MGRKFIVDYDEFLKEDFVHCIVCKTRIGSIHEFIKEIENGNTVVFNKVFNVQVDKEKYHKQVNGNSVADTYCLNCGMLLGMKLILVPNSHQNASIIEGRFLMSNNQLVFWNNVRMFITDEDEEDDANEQDHDHDDEHDSDQD
ncbi:protein yippee-like At3g08990 [Solanum dulcamara]|uniref:protein yippee-like At3g08990 n=1 Tax=Solanum dulcamara TaxID=45834 RepID=UPI002485EBE0|nr:protein yippee-like At3g08990 [Solanum dulcamara]